MYPHDPYWKNPAEEAQQLSLYNSKEKGPIWSTDKPTAAVDHELGHYAHQVIFPKAFDDCKTIITRKERDLLLEKLSWNAVRFFEDDEDKGNFKRTCREIVAEVWAKLASGQHVKPEVMEIYKRILNNEV